LVCGWVIPSVSLGPDDHEILSLAVGVVQHHSASPGLLEDLRAGAALPARAVCERDVLTIGGRTRSIQDEIMMALRRFVITTSMGRVCPLSGNYCARRRVLCIWLIEQAHTSDVVRTGVLTGRKSTALEWKNCPSEVHQSIRDCQSILLLEESEREGGREHKPWLKMPSSNRQSPGGMSPSTPGDVVSFSVHRVSTHWSKRRGESSYSHSMVPGGLVVASMATPET